MQYVSQQITDFTSTNLTDDYLEWDETTTYNLETDNENLTNASMVRYGTYYYRSLTNGNLGFNPTEYENIKWVKYGVSNKYAMLDLKSNTKSSVENTDLEVTFLQEQMRVLGIGNYTASEIQITIYDVDGTTELWTYSTGNTVNEEVVDYYTYIYSDYGFEVDRAIKVDLPLVGEYVKVVFKNSTETINTSCGFLVGGEAVDMGCTIFNVNFNFNSFAVKEFDDFGSLNIVKRGVQDIVDFQTLIPSEETQTLKREIKKIYNDIVMFIVDERENDTYENILTLGVIQKASVILKNHDKTTISYSIIEAI